MFSFQLFLFAFSALTSASFSAPPSSSDESSITWLEHSRSAIIKLNTPGYPLWIMDKTNAPPVYRDAAPYYWSEDTPSAVLLNITMSPDNKTLYLNHEAILPLRDNNVPPSISAYQVPASTTEKEVQGYASAGLLNREWEGITLSTRWLQLDYDRLVWSDPAAGPWHNHLPTLRFRIMGLGAHSNDSVLPQFKQSVLHVTLTDSNHRSSTDPKRSYFISDIQTRSVQDSLYDYVPWVQPDDDDEKCTLKSWRCSDDDFLYQEGPFYRFIWRRNFDQYGRVGSLRHHYMQKLHAVGEFVNTSAPAMLFSFVLLSVLTLAGYGAVLLMKCVTGERARIVRELAEEDRLLGEKEEEEMLFEDDGSEDEDLPPPPLPPRHIVQRKEEQEDLIVL